MTTKLRVFLVQTAQGLTPSSGGYKANYNLLRLLGSQGHFVGQICYGFHDEVDESINRAKENKVNPRATYVVVPVPDARGVVHDLVVRTFYDQYKILNIVLSRDVFNLAFPVREL